MSRHGRVLVAMSGGVDSSAAAVMLHEQGYEVVGATMKTWDFATSMGDPDVAAGGAHGAKKVSGCCSLDDMNDARAVAVGIGAAHLVVDLRAEFGTAVQDRFVADYLAGRTPNPCVLCNTHVKWGALARRADALGCEHLATGHYARIVRTPAGHDGAGHDGAGHDGDVPDGDVPDGAGRYAVARGADRAKDQSYVLWGVSQAHLARTLLPLGGLTKPEIRALAAEAGLAVAQKKDSYEICFVPDDDYRAFLRRRVPGLDAAVDGGPFVHAVSGEALGRHRGAPFYTVGQRRGLGLAAAEPLYVTAIDVATNTVSVGPRSALGARALTADGVVWGAVPGFGTETAVRAQVRAHGAAEPALARHRVNPDRTGPDTLEVVFAEPRDAVAPGQAVVLYDAERGETVLAGGWIATAEPAGVSAGDPDFIALDVL